MSPERRGGTAAVTFILITVLIDTIGFGIIIPVMPELITELTGEGLSEAAIYGGWMQFLYAAMQFVFAPILGNLSDRFGRRPVLLLSLAMLGVDYIILGLSTSIVWLFVGRTLAGISGATFSTANAYVADSTGQEERAAAFGRIGAMWGLGFILGPVIGGVLGEYGSRVPFFAAAGLSALNVLFGLFVLPESLPKDQRRPFHMKRANPVGAILQMRQYPLVLWLLLAALLYQIAHDANPSTWTYYTMLKFDWGKAEVGYSLGFVGLMITIVQGGLIGPVIARLGERVTVRAGFFVMATGYLGFAFATSTFAMFAFIVPFALGAVGMPAMRSIMSRAVPANQQGELQGALTSLMSLTAIGAPLVMTRLFGYFSSDQAPVYFPGAPFLLAGLLMLIAAAYVPLVLRRHPVERDDVPEGLGEELV